ncbi:MAG: Fe-S cluster assembly protein SufD [Porticoccaceae bacterium]|nr:MAG: Fe-S cluster assembly protein SufD [Porticoccaceae bacterium]
MADYLATALARQAPPAAPWLASVRARGAEEARRARLPTIRDEAWRYTSLRPLLEGNYTAPPAEAGPLARWAEAAELGLAAGPRLVFVNGRFCAALSRATPLPEGVVLSPLSDLDEVAGARLAQSLGRLAPPGERVFTALNQWWLEDGAVLWVRDGLELAEPIHLLWLGTPQPSPASVAQRLQVVLGAGARATVVEHFATGGAGERLFTNGVSEFELGEGACLRHCRVHLEGEQALAIGLAAARLAAGARLEGFHAALGGQLTRVELHVALEGEGASCELTGLYLPRRREVFDYHTCVEHRSPNAASEQAFRGIAADRARAVFNGRIHIHPGARGSVAHLVDRNILGNDEAEVDVKPELEIYNDDVQCSHGATVAQWDERQLFYLRSRGVPEAEARVLLGFAFANEVLERFPLQELRQRLRARLLARLAVDPQLARHLT